MIEDKNPAQAKTAVPSKQIVSIDQQLFRDVEVSLEARLGGTRMSVEMLMALKSGSVVTLDSGLADHVDLLVNGFCIARGEIVAVDDHFGVRIIELASQK